MNERISRFKTIIAKTILVGLTSTIIQPIALAAVKTDLSVYTDIGNLYLKSFDMVERKEKIPEQLKKEGKKLTLQSRALSEGEKRKIVFNTFAQHLSTEKSDAIDPMFLKKMEIFCGGEDGKLSLFSKINRTQTVFGEAALARMLAEPTIDIKVLKTRQRIVQELLENEDAFDELENILAHVKQAEAKLLSFWDKENSINEELFKKVYFASKWLSWFNKSSVALELSTRLDDMEKLLIATCPVLFDIAGIYLQGHLSDDSISGMEACKQGLNNFKESIPKAGKYLDPRLDHFKENGLPDMHEKFTQEAENRFDALIFKVNLQGDHATARNFQQQEDNWKKLFFLDVEHKERDNAITIADDAHWFYHSSYPRPIKGMIFGKFIGLKALYAWLNYKSVNDALEKKKIANHIQDKMIGVGTCVRGMKAVYHVATQYPALFEHVPALTKFEELVNGSDNLSSNFKHLANLLDYRTFKGNASVFSITGRALAAYQIMKEVKDELIPFMQALGEVDAYLSIAKLYKEFAEKRVDYSFVEFVESDTPFIEITDFWNLFVDPEIVVTNDLVMGAKDKPNNIILTGPNTGGKSTVIKGILINIFLAQTIGIAPAKHVALTPFTNVNCYLNITDDISAGTSLFKAEVLRAKALLESIRTLKDGKFSFTIMDEVFSGTSPKEGEEVAYMFTEQLGNFDNSMLMLATHFPKVTELDEKKAAQFKNYQVKGIKEDNGTLTRPYRLEEGKSFLNIAIDLLKEEGVL